MIDIHRMTTIVLDIMPKYRHTHYYERIQFYKNTITISFYCLMGALCINFSLTLKISKIMYFISYFRHLPNRSWHKNVESIYTTKYTYNICFLRLFLMLMTDDPIVSTQSEIAYWGGTLRAPRHEAGGARAGGERRVALTCQHGDTAAVSRRDIAARASFYIATIRLQTL